MSMFYQVKTVVSGYLAVGGKRPPLVVDKKWHCKSRLYSLTTVTPKVLLPV